MIQYRHGGKQPRNIYRVTDEHPEGEYIGVFFDEADSEFAVQAMNAAESPPLMSAWASMCAPSVVTDE